MTRGSIALLLAAAGLLACAQQAPPPGTPASALQTKGKATYTYLDTQEGDWYGPSHRKNPEFKPPADRPIELAAVPCPPKKNDGKTFDGCRRALAKTTFANDPTVEQFATVAKLRAALVPDNTMEAKKVSGAPNSKRVAEEERNVVVRAFIFAVKYEDDNDYHLILGDRNCAGPECFLTAEVSGLSRFAPAQQVLKQARDAFEDFFVQGFPQGKYRTFPQTPIPVVVAGSLFWDTEHSAGDVGPGKNCARRPSGALVGCRPSTAWEIHPVTRIAFETEHPILVGAR